MKNERIDLKSPLTKKVVLQNISKSEELISKQVSEIHNKKSEIIRTTIHLPKDIHTKIKVYCANNSLSFKEYVTNLIRKNITI